MNLRDVLHPRRETPDEAFEALGDWSDPGADRAAAVLLEDDHGRVLLQLRDPWPGVLWGGMWACFGGGAEGEETLPEAAVREVAEEIGVALKPQELTPFARVLSDLPGRRRIYFFIAHLAVPTRALKLDEGAGFGLFEPAQARALTVPPHIAPVIDAWAKRHGG